MTLATVSVSRRASGAGRRQMSLSEDTGANFGRGRWGDFKASRLKPPLLPGFSGWRRTGAHSGSPIRVNPKATEVLHLREMMRWVIINLPELSRPSQSPQHYD